MRVPFDWSGGQATFAGSQTVHSSASGIGNVSVNVIKQLLHEHGYLPDVLFNVAYTADTGSSSRSKAQISTFPFAVGTGYGFDTLSAGVTLLKRQDPLVLLGAFTYTHSFSNQFLGVNVQPGSSAEIRIGPILATSPDTSVRILFDTAFQSRERDNGARRGRLRAGDFGARVRRRRCARTACVPGCLGRHRADARHAEFPRGPVAPHSFLTEGSAA